MDNMENTRAFRLTKDTPTAKAGVVFVARSVAPTMPIDNYEFRAKLAAGRSLFYMGKDITDSPSFFEEVFCPTPLWLNAKELKKYQANSGGRKK